jgi:tRNA-modifying protein YgfZ
MFSLDHYRAVREAAGFIDRSSRARLRLTGRDRRDYLQGLLTNDIVALAPGQGCYAALLTAQGRMIADMFVVETGEAIVMDLEPAVGDKVAAHLDRFIFSEDAQVANETASTAQIGVFGPASAAVVASVVGGDVRREELETLPVLGNRRAPWRSGSVLVVRRDDLGVSGFDVIVDRSAAPALIDALVDAGVSRFEEETAEVLRVEHERPRFLQDMTEDTIPLEAGIDERALSMTKGCYVGQEVIVRVLHRGHGRVARRLVGLTIDRTAAVPAAGDRIRAAADPREIGVITSAVWSPAMNGPVALGYVHRDFAEDGTAVTVESGAARATATVRRLSPSHPRSDAPEATPADR